MVALTYGDTRVSGVETKTATKTATKTPTKTVATTAPRPGFFARFYAALMESRMRQAEREIRLHAPLLRPLHDAQDLPFQSVSKDTPRGGW